MYIYFLFNVENKYLCVIIYKYLYINQNIAYYYKSLYYNSYIRFIINQCLYINKKIL